MSIAGVYFYPFLNKQLLMIRSLLLRNWRSHSETKLEFSKGTNLLVGIMGSGKSSVLDGISFALFGTFPALERRKLKTTDLIRLEQDESETALEFSWNGSDYLVSRKLSRTKRGTNSEASISKNRALVESGPKAVTSYIEQILGIDYDLFTRAIYSEQNNTDYFLNLDPRRRKQEMDSLLGLDRFETARSNIISVINRIRANRKFIEGQFSQQRLDELEAEKNQTKEKSALIKSKREKTIEELASKKEELSRKTESFNALKEKKKAHESAKEELLQKKGHATSLESALSNESVTKEEFQNEKDARQLLINEHEGLKKELANVLTEHSNLIRKAAAAESEIKSLEKSTNEKQNLEVELQSILGNSTSEKLLSDAELMEKEQINLNSEKSSLESKIRELEKTLLTLKPGQSQCPVCGNELGPDHMEQLSKEKNNAMQSARKRIAEITGIIPQKESARKNLLEKSRRAAQISERINNIQEEQKRLPELRSNYEEMKNKLIQSETAKKNLDSKLEVLISSIRKKDLLISKKSAILEKMADLEKTKKKLQELEERIKQTAFDESVFDNTRSKMEELRITSERLSMESSSLEKEIDSLNKIMPLIDKELESLKNTKIQVARSHALEDELAIFKNGLIETQLSLRSSLTDAINKAMNEVWAIFYPYRNYPSIRLSITEKDYLFEVYDHAKWKSLESVASGGERASAALTLRVALAMVLTPSLSWLVLDEPTHNLDMQAISLLSETLQLKVPEVVNQTFVITHEEDLMGTDFASSYRLDRDKGKNGPTTVVKI
jgi:exonuclease SbcC